MAKHRFKVVISLGNHAKDQYMGFRFLATMNRYANSQRIVAAGRGVLLICALSIQHCKKHEQDPSSTQAQKNDAETLDRERQMVRTHKDYTYIAFNDGLNCIWYYADNAMTHLNPSSFYQAVRFKCIFKKHRTPKDRECQVEFWSTPHGRFVFGMEVFKGEDKIFFRARGDKSLRNLSRDAIARWLNRYFVRLCTPIMEMERKSTIEGYGFIDVRSGPGAIALRKIIQKFRRMSPALPVQVQQQSVTPPKR